LLDDEDVSREHVQLVRRAGGVLVRDLGSKNGACLGESRLVPDRDTAWRAPTMLRMGKTVVALDEPVAEALAELESAPDDVLPDEGAPPPPRSSAPAAAAVPVPGASAAPMVAPSASALRPTPGARGLRGWSGADMAVVVAALCIMALSAAGLYWLLRG
jgi:hypothetical protein